MKNLTFLIVLILSFLLTYSQENIIISKEKFKIPNKKGFLYAWHAVQLGDKYYNEHTRGGYLYAIENYKIAYEYNPNLPELNYKLGASYLFSVYKDSALYFLKKAYKANPNIASDILWLLGLAYHYNYQFDSAIYYIKKYKQSLPPTMLITRGPEIEKKLQECYNAKELIKHPTKVIIENISEINTIYPEYCPVITADESELYFTARRPDCIGGEIDPADGQFYEDIFVAFKKKNSWTPPYNAGPPLNTKFHDATVGLTPDGRKMIIYRNGDLYISERIREDKWSYPEPLPPQINTDEIENHACFSYDGKTIYFIRGKIPGSPQSNGDIYVSHYVNGKWTEPQPLPDNINTPYDEDGVYMLPDGKTLFFSSKGHNSMGGYDIFVTYRKDDGSWTDPINLGYPINTPDDDIYLVVAANGIYGYYSSIRKDTKGFNDIYKITFVDKIPLFLSSEDLLIAGLAKPVKENLISTPSTKLTLIVGYIRDKNTNKPLKADIEVYDIEKDSLIITTQSSQKTGKFIVTLPSGKNYGLIVKRNGYLFYSENFNLPEDAAYQKIEKTIYLQTIEEGAKVVLKNIFFDFDKATLRPESYAELNQVVQFLKQYPNIRIEISGHTDNIGSYEYNKRLSEARAKAVVDYLISKGISPDRLTYRGAAYDEPIAPNDTPEGRALNRRVEFKIISF